LFKKLSLELGGKNASVVFADADLDQCLPTIARAAFLNQGEICLCGSRILAHRSVYDRVVEHVVQYAKTLQCDDPALPTTNFGALISSDHRDKVARYVALAREQGGEVVAGGSIPAMAPPFDQGYFFEPTVITGLSSSARCAQEEVFGPLVTIHPFDTDEQAVEMHNSVPYGLALSLWTRDVSRAHIAARTMEAGIVQVRVMSCNILLGVGELLATARPSHPVWRDEAKWRRTRRWRLLTRVLLGSEERLHQVGLITLAFVVNPSVVRHGLRLLLFASTMYLSRWSQSCGCHHPLHPTSP